jgi:hypothetical protein
VERGLEEVTTEQDKVLGARAEARTEAGTSSQWPPNWTIRFPKLDHPISTVSGQKQMSRTTAPGTTPTPRWCPPGLTHSQRRMIKRMRA